MQEDPSSNPCTGNVSDTDYDLMMNAQDYQWTHTVGGHMLDLAFCHMWYIYSKDFIGR